MSRPRKSPLCTDWTRKNNERFTSSLSLIKIERNTPTTWVKNGLTLFVLDILKNRQDKKEKETGVSAFYTNVENADATLCTHYIKDKNGNRSIF